MFSLLAFLLYLAYPAFGWTYYSRLWQRRLHLAVFFLVLFAVGYVLYVAAVRLDGWELERDLYSYDLNGDREFSEAEQTPAMKLAMQRYANDTGRMLVPLLAAPITLVWVAANLWLVTGCQWVFRKLRRTTVTA